MMATKADKRTVQLVQGQRVYSGLYGGRHGIIVAVHGTQRPLSVGTMGGGVVSYGGSATVDVAFDTGINKGIPESIIRGVQWEIYEAVATDDELLDLVLKGNQYQSDAKAKAERKAAEFRAECERLRTDAAFSHLTQGTDRKTAAANIRKELKREFPGVKFGVRCSTGSGIDVSWTDGPTEEQVKAVTNRHKTGYYDMHTDYHGSDAGPFATVFGGSDYLFHQRETTPELEAKAWRVHMGDSTGFQCGKEFIPADLPADWSTRYHNTDTLYHIRKAIRDFAG